MKILHTSDWHVGKVLKGRDRYEEHAAALASITAIARAEDVDLVLIAGDLFETAAPTAKAQGLVMRTLLALREDGRQVVAIAGNHDNASLLDEVYRPVLGEVGLHLLGLPKRPEYGGTVALRTRGGEQVNVAALPFLSRRYAIRAAEALLHEFADLALDYSRQMTQLVALLTEPFSPDAVNIVMAHATLLGGRRGGGERDVQTGLDYEVPASIFPATAHYAALGHLHRSQEIPGPCPMFYSGSPLAIDFGEEKNESSALIVTLRPDARADARQIPVTGGRPLRTLRGTLDQVIADGEQAGDAYLRVILAEPGRAGLADLVREKLPNTLEVLLDEAHRPRPGTRDGDRPSRVGRSPVELFGDYLAERKIDDPRLGAMFSRLLDEVTGAAAEPGAGEPGAGELAAGEAGAGEAGAGEAGAGEAGAGEPGAGELAAGEADAGGPAAARRPGSGGCRTAGSAAATAGRDT
jgi:exonuclease SbcD